MLAVLVTDLVYVAVLLKGEFIGKTVTALEDL